MTGNSPAAGTAARPAVSTPQPAQDAQAVVYVGYYEDRRARVDRFPGQDPLDVEPSRAYASHAREFEWGYNGSGPAQLALAILLDYYDEPAVACEYYQRFCKRVVSDLETDATGTWRLTGSEIDQAVAAIREARTDG